MTKISVLYDQFHILSGINEYAVASTNDAAYLIGGCHGPSRSLAFNTIAEFRDNKWTQYGTLNTARRVPGYISSGDETLLIGGYGDS